MLYLFLVLLVIFMIRYWYYQFLCQRQKMVSDLADSRRQLMSLVHKGMVDSRSEVFQFYYKMFEMLIRIRYGKKDHFSLPHPFRVVKAVSSKYQNSKMENIKLEKAELHKNDQTGEIRAFFHQASTVLIDSFIKDKQVVLFLLASKLASLLAKLGFFKAQDRWYFTMNVYNDSIKDMNAIISFDKS